MSRARADPRSQFPKLDDALKALVRLLARQVALDVLTSNPKEKEADHEHEEGCEGAAEAVAQKRSG